MALTSGANKNDVLMPNGTQPDLPNLPFEQWLSPKELAGRFFLNEESAYRWRTEGLIPEHFVRFRGTRLLMFHPKAIEHLQEIFRKAHD
jgi:hypothetical protein